jgi:glycosyltransferase involved in cell wall biosynthesis
MHSHPRVSVGIPTYNRPDGLLRTIKQITAQSYTNLEIVISNNASPNPMIAAIADHCATLDSRIKVYHQTENVGVIRNFKFVLRAATSEYFMWAADDDEWDVRFVEVCLEQMTSHSVGTVMPGFQRHFRALNNLGVAQLPRMEGKDRFADVMAFYQCMAHSIFYGLHKKSTIAWYLEEDDGLNDDEYFLMRQMLRNGVLTIPDQILYRAGIDDAQYTIKFREASDRYYYQCKRLLNFAALINESDMLTDQQKLILLQKVLLCKLGFVASWEKGIRDPAQYALAQSLRQFIEQIDLSRLDAYTKLLGHVNANAAKQAVQ